MKHYQVVAAIIESDGKILCMQRKESKYEYLSYKFEFPGGKIEQDETEEEALMREIFEELDFHIAVKNKLITVNHTYPDFYITMHGFICEPKSKEITLKEHYSFKWLEISRLNTLDWAAADIPIVSKIIETIA